MVGLVLLYYGAEWLVRGSSSLAGSLGMQPIVIGLTVACAGWFGVHPPGFVTQVVAWAFGMAAASFFPAIILGIFTIP